MDGLAALPELAVLNFVAENDRDKLVSILDENGLEVLTFDGSRVHDRHDLLSAAGVQLFEGQPVVNWSDFAARLEERLTGLGKERIAVLWTGVDAMLVRGLSDLVQALDIILRISRELYAQRTTFVVFLLGEGPNFPPLRSAE